MSIWRAAKARRVCAALLRLGWTLKKQVGSHRKLQGAGWSNFTFYFHDKEEVGPAALAKIAEETGLRGRKTCESTQRLLGWSRSLAAA